MKAIRTFVSYDELAALLRLDEGRRIEAVTVAPMRYGLGIEVMVTGEGLPEPTENLGVHHSPGWAKRALEEWSGIKGRREGYTPARPAVAASDPAAWPAFPGQDLNYRGDPDTLEEQIHTGGPR